MIPTIVQPDPSSSRMKLFLLSSFLLAFAFPGIWAACSIGIGVLTSKSIVITLSPTPEAVIAGSRTGLSPKEIVDNLNQTASANTVIQGVRALAPLSARSLGPVATCNFYWISNKLFCINVNTVSIALLCTQFSIILSIDVPVVVPAPVLPLLPTPDPCANVTNGVPWGITKINAATVRSGNYSGQGIVVASLDTGVRSTHDELVGKMRDTYNWKDPYNISSTPTDVSGHGTHTTATMVGKTVGVAPNAKFIACRLCSYDKCTEEAINACAQWAACPNPDDNCTAKPHIINNSWGDKNTTDISLVGILATWASMNIAFFFSAGNNGGNCSTAGSPGNSNSTKYGFLSVGATACNETIAPFSGAGPSKSPSNPGGLVPQISAPGLYVYSAWNTSDTAYKTISGTSMAAPHVSGAAACVLSKNKGLTPTQLDNVLTSTAWQNPNIKDNSQYCGGPSSGGYPNNIFGNGRLDVLAALNSVTAG